MGSSIDIEVDRFFDGTVEDSKRTIDDLTTAVQAKWVDLANSELHATAKDYVIGIQRYPAEEVGGTVTGIVELIGSLPNMIEQGATPWDMKGEKGVSGILKNVTGDKKTATIFMRKGVAAKNLNNMTPHQHSIMKKVETRKGNLPAFLQGGGNKVKGYGVHHSSSPFRGTNVSPKGMTTHKNHVYDKMQKIVRTSGVSYGTFRSVSLKSDEAAWWHPGFIAKNLADKAVQELGLT